MLLTAVAAGVAAAAVSAAVARRWPLLPAASVVAVASTVAVVAALGGTLLDVLTGPLGYANATASFFVVAAAAAVVLHQTAARPTVRARMLVVAIALASVPWLNRSRAGAVGALVVLAGLLPWVRRQGIHRLAVVTGAMLLVAMATTVAVAIAWSASPEPGPVAVAIEVDATRTALWHKAVTLLASQPLQGVGRGDFATAAPPATAPYERFAHHDYLQAGAELGVAGPALLLAGLAWLWWRLRRGPDTPSTRMAILALTAVALHMTVDYVGQFPAVLAPLGALVGAGLSETRAAAGRNPGARTTAQPSVSARGQARGRSGPARRRRGPGSPTRPGPRPPPRPRRP